MLCGVRCIIVQWFNGPAIAVCLTWASSHMDICWSIRSRYCTWCGCQTDVSLVCSPDVNTRWHRLLPQSWHRWFTDSYFSVSSTGTDMSQCRIQTGQLFSHQPSLCEALRSKEATIRKPWDFEGPWWLTGKSEHRMRPCPYWSCQGSIPACGLLLPVVPSLPPWIYLSCYPTWHKI